MDGNGGYFCGVGPFHQTNGNSLAIGSGPDNFYCARDGFSILKKKGWVIFAGYLALEVGPWLLKKCLLRG